MAYTIVNYKTKKALREDVLAGKEVRVYQPSPWGNRDCPDGTCYLEGPHYPQPHTWYAQATVKNGRIISIKK